MIENIDNKVKAALFEHLGHKPRRIDYQVTEVIKELGRLKFKIMYKKKLIKEFSL